MSRSACRTATAAAMARGIRRTAPWAAASRISRALTASACITALQRTSARIIQGIEMKKAGAVAALTVSLLSGVYVAYAGQQMPMSFFVTSVGVGKGGDLGGLAGADAHCQMLAAAAGATGKTWRAYLS